MYKEPKERKFDLQKPLDMVRFAVRTLFLWQGGYEVVLITQDGGLICATCVKENYKLIFSSTKNEDDSQWQIVAMTNESELENLYCDHCGKEIGYHEETEEK